MCLGFSFGGIVCFSSNDVYAIDGGAVFLKEGASYTMNGGSIRNKTADNGGAVYISSGATFTMNGGTISGNTATKGSGVYAASGGTFNMNGGTMADSVYSAGTMVYGGGTVSGNITLDGAEKLTINETPDSPLKVTALTTAVGTKLAKVNANDFTISDITVSGLPTGRRAILSGGYVVVDYIYYTITINVNNSAYGTVSKTSISVPYGSSISASGATLTVGSQTITATPTTDTAQYDYSFSSWTGASGTVTGNKTITANFTRTTKQYTVTITSNNSSYGVITNNDTASSSGTMTVKVNYGSTLVLDGDVLLVADSYSYTATPSARTAEYTYAFSSWVVGFTTVTSDTTVTASFTRTTNQYTVTLGSSSYGSWNTATAITVNYGTSISVSSNKLTVGSTTRTFTASADTDQYDYTFNSLTGVPSGGKVIENVTITPSVSRATKQYTVTLGTGYGSWNTATAITVNYGTSISVSSNKLTVGSTTRTFTASADTAQYDYTFNSLSGVPSGGKVIANVTITPNVSRTTKSYTVTISTSPSGYGTVSKTSVTVPYGTSISASGATLTVGSNTITATATTATAQYTYSFSSWTGASGTVTGNKTITANFTRTTNQYTVTLGSSSYGSWNTATAITVNYGTSISVSSNKLTVGSTTRTFTASADTDQYDYTFNSLTGVPSGGKVIENVTITPSVSRATKQYTVTLGTGYGSWNTATAITVNYGTSISVSSNKLTVGSTTRTFTASADTAQYDYTFNSLSGVPSGGKVIANVTITPNVSRTTKSYTVTISASPSGYGTVSKTSVTVPYGTSISTSGATLTIGSTTITATATTQTAQYSYAFSSWSNAGTSVTGTKTITANFTRTTRNYGVVISSGAEGYIVKNGTNLGTGCDISVAYGTVWSIDGDTLTIGGDSYQAVANSGYVFDSWTWTGSGTITCDDTITANFTEEASGNAYIKIESDIEAFDGETVWYNDYEDCYLRLYRNGVATIYNHTTYEEVDIFYAGANTPWFAYVDGEAHSVEYYQSTDYLQEAIPITGNLEIGLYTLEMYYISVDGEYTDTYSAYAGAELYIDNGGNVYFSDIYTEDTFYIIEQDFFNTESWYVEVIDTLSGDIIEIIDSVVVEGESELLYYTKIKKSITIRIVYN